MSVDGIRKIRSAKDRCQTGDRQVTIPGVIVMENTMRQEKPIFLILRIKITD